MADLVLTLNPDRIALFNFAYLPEMIKHQTLIPPEALPSPQVKLDISFSDRKADLIEEGFDLAIRIGTLPESGLIARKLGSTRIIVCASPDYLKRRGTPQTPEDLASHSCLGYTLSNSGDEWRLTRQDEEAAIRIAGPIKADNGDMLRLAALSGGPLLYARIDALALQRDLIVARFLARAA